MTLNRVDYYEVQCDSCGDRTGDIGDYAAWSDPGVAEGAWISADGVVLKNDKHYCSRCVPANFCEVADDGVHVVEPDGTICTECGRVCA